jgi:CMP-N,N'-diacetyllegionaminic acid synthase
VTHRRRVLAVIPARGGSVGVPRKNLRPVGGTPLVALAIKAAAGSRLVDRVIVSTDDAEIAAVARDVGGQVPFCRPAQLALGTSRMFDVLVHAVETLEGAGEPAYDDIVLLQPTSPFRLPTDVDECLTTLWSTGCDSVITVYRHPQLHPRFMYSLGPGGVAAPLWEAEDRMPQRQDLDPVFIRTGVVYAFRRSLLRRGGDIYGKRTVAVQIPYERSFSIDDPTDLAVCEAFAQRRSLDAAAMATGLQGAQTSSLGAAIGGTRRP